MSKNLGQQKAKQEQSSAARAHYIVGIGASAGGLEAINEFFDHIPEGQGFSFVVIQHLSPNHKSLMDELLAKHTSMQIERAEEGMLIKPNHVYLIPSRKNMTVQHGRLRLTNRSDTAVPHHTINIFLESLAKDKQQHAIGVILSGTGSDGTQGLEAIRQQGGYAIVQDPTTAKFDGMPQSAITAGVYDIILPPAEMGKEIFEYPNLLGEQEKSAVPGNEIADCLPKILRLVSKAKNIDFSSYKEQTLIRRIKRRMQLSGYNHVMDYLDHLKVNEDELKILAEEFLIGVTSFFRDPEAFKLLEEQVIPEILEKKDKGDPVKIWTVACSTGEEAYTMAILLSEALERIGKDLVVKIFATDIDQNALEIASKGIYPETIAEHVSKERLDKYFVKEGKTYMLSQAVRRMVIFAQHNVIKDPPFSKMDLVSCRNMLIYMKPSLQQKVLSVFHFSLQLGGYLFLGTSENAEYLKNSLDTLSKKWSLYKTKAKSKNFIFDGKVIDKEKGLTVRPVESRPVAPSLDNTTIQDAFIDLMTQELGYTALFVNENFQLLQAMGDYQSFLNLPKGSLELNLLKLLPRELATAASLSLRKALRNNERVSNRWIEVVDAEKVRYISLTAQPYQPKNKDKDTFIALLLREEENEKTKGPIERGEEKVDIDRLLELEKELKQAKADLQSTIEELEASNEEMQSSNEELISSNEELQSTNEELQSVNEELHTVNAEHQQKIRELEELNDDLNNFFRSTAIGQVFVDQEMRIRKFTPSAKKLVNLIESDLNRPIDHITFNFPAKNFLTDIEKVIRNEETLEEEIQAKNGRYYLKRIMPYVRQDKTVDGAVISFVDITIIKELNNKLQGVLESSTNGIMAFSPEDKEEGDPKKRLKITLANYAIRKIFDLEEPVQNGAYLEDVFPALHQSPIYEKLIQVADSRKPLHTEFRFVKGKEVCWLELIAVATDTGLALTVVDITEKKEAEAELLHAYEEVKEAEEKLLKLNSNLERRVEERTRELKESEERFRLVTQATNDAVWDWNLINNTFWWNEGLSKIYGIQEDLDSGVESWFGRLPEEERAKISSSIDEAINQGERQWSAEHRFRKADGSLAYVYNRAYILKNEYGVPYRALGSMVDLTNLKQTQEELELSNRTLQKINTDLDNFVYTASHDLRAPVANMEGLLDLLGPDLQEKLNDRQRKLFGMITESVAKLREIIRSLTEVTQVQQDVETYLQEIHFAEMLDDIKQDLRNKIQNLDPLIETDFSCKTVVFTPIHLRSILFNLLSNALKFHKPGERPEIKIATRGTENGYCELSFSDKGIGIPEKYQQKIFSMFKRFNREIEGTGIGLYMVKRIIENHNGEIRVESTPGEGTTFTILIPSQNREAHNEQEAEGVNELN